VGGHDVEDLDLALFDAGDAEASLEDGRDESQIFGRGGCPVGSVLLLLVDQGSQSPEATGDNTVQDGQDLLGDGDVALTWLGSALLRSTEDDEEDLEQGTEIGQVVCSEWVLDGVDGRGDEGQEVGDVARELVSVGQALKKGQGQAGARVAQHDKDVLRGLRALVGLETLLDDLEDLPSEGGVLLLREKGKGELK